MLLNKLSLDEEAMNQKDAETLAGRPKQEVIRWNWVGAHLWDQADVGLNRFCPL